MQSSTQIERQRAIYRKLSFKTYIIGKTLTFYPKTIKQLLLSAKWTLVLDFAVICHV